jgi:putative nucleotidyltransferase with HDIG domain
MKVKPPKKVAQIIDTFEKHGYEIYIVGGAVRDLLMKKIVYDWDFTTNATPKDVQEMFADAYYTNDFGMVGLPPEKDGDRPYEITTFRTEHGYSDTRRPDEVKWGKDIKEDLKRRDFTINAMALRRKKGSCEITDLFSGQKDLKDKLVRAVGDPDERFSEDALRMMRAVRIATELNFKIEKKTLSAIKKNKKLIHNISKERIKDELFKILASEHPYEGMLLLRESEISQEILPELEKTFGVEQKSPGRHHVYDVGTHSMLSLKNCPSEDPVVRFATLIHDVGKAQTRKVLENGTVTFYNHELVSAKIAKKISKRLRFSKKESEKFWRLVRYHQFTVDEKQTDSAIRRFIRKVGLDYVPDMLDLRTGDRLGGGARETSWRLEEFKKRLIEVQKQPFAIRDLKISGDDVMKELNLKPGPKVGKILQKLFDDVVEKKIENSKESLLDKLKDLK